MPKRMLVDASHPEETRVVVLDGNRVEEFDFEAATKRPLKGNIYLAKVTRVEPSLQAAFVEYGGNRQGFLAFSEIHPDYYQIPVADRMAILEAQTRRMMAEEDFDAVDTASAPAQQPMLTDERPEIHADGLPAADGADTALAGESAEEHPEAEGPADHAEADLRAEASNEEALAVAEPEAPEEVFENVAHDDGVADSQAP